MTHNSDRHHINTGGQALLTSELVAPCADKISATRRAVLRSLLAGAAGACLEGSAQFLSGELAPARSGNSAPRFGMNYIPRKNWWYIWQDWDPQSIADDLHAIADLKMDHIRIQCLWPYFQPAISFVSPVALERLHQMLDLADAVGLDVEVTVLNGWMSGFAFLPAWVNPLSTDRTRNVFTHSDVIEGEKLLFKSIADAVGSHRRFMGFDIANEIDALLSFGNHAETSELDRWATTLLAYCNSIAPGKFHVNGINKVSWFNDVGFSRCNLVTAGSATVLHYYAFFSGATEHFRYNEVGSLHMLEFQVELVKALQRDSHRPVWVEEVGASSEWMPEGYIPDYAINLIRNAASCGNIWGYTWWGSHDIEPSIKGFGSLEYNLGALDTSNRVKPLGKALANLAEEMRQRPPEAPFRASAIVLPDQGFPVNGEVRMWRVARQFMDLVRAGKHPSFVLEGRTKDSLYLQMRGITDLIKLDQA